ncbi:MAG: Cache 3/Cache 2 fusion domain-containing protein, partial [Pseudomonadota bacterium]
MNLNTKQKLYTGQLLLIFLVIIGMVAIYFSVRKVVINMYESELSTILDAPSLGLKTAYKDALYRQKKNMENLAPMFDGKVTLDESRKEKISIENQVSKEKSEIEIPKMQWEGKDLYHNLDVVTQIAKSTDSTVTIFQMIPQGMLRVTTTIKKKDGTLAIGTFIPTDSKVYQAIEKGENYFGLAYVVDGHYITGYHPIKKDGKVIAAIFTGVSSEVLEEVKDMIRKIKVYDTGYFYIMDMKANLILHPKLEGTSLYETKDIKGYYFAQDMLQKKNGIIHYYWPDASGRPKEKVVSFHYLEELDWMIAAGTNLEEVQDDIILIKEKIIIIVG